ncbi:MAG: ABC transporter substrate-binding protein, partial [Myxococcota bacterium]
EMKRPLWPLRPSALLIGYCALLLASCVGPGGFGERVPAEQRRAYDAALELLLDDPAAAQTRFEAFLQDFPASPLADDATEELARLALLQGRRAEAFDRLRDVIRTYPKGNRVDSVRVRLARWEWDQGQYYKARQLLEGVRVGNLDPSDRRDLSSLLAKMSEDPVERLVHLAALRRQWSKEISRQVDRKVSPDQLRQTDAQLQAVDAEIAGQLRAMTWEQLVRVSQDLGTQIPAGRIQLIMVWREMAGGQLERARQRLSELEEYPLSPDDEERLANLQQRLQDDAHATTLFVPSFEEALARSWPGLEGAEGTLGVVLPLSGRYGPFGRAALQGVLLAVNIFEAEGGQPAESAEIRPDPRAAAGFVPSSSGDRDDPPPGELWVGPGPERPRGVRLLVRDTAGQPELAAAAVRELAADESVLAVIGPIFSAESEAAATQAERLGIPLLALSNRSAIPDEKQWVFRLRMTPEDEVGALVEFAVDRMKLNTFAILYPLNRYGRGMRARYWDTVQAYGGQVVAVAGYEPGAT